MRAARAALPIVLLAVAAGCARSASATADPIAQCRGTRYVMVRNVLPERAYVRLTTTDNRVFFVDTPLASGEVRRIGVPRGTTVRRADGSSEAWKVVPPGRVAPADAVRQEPGAGGRSVTSQLEMQMGCAEE